LGIASLEDLFMSDDVATNQAPAAPAAQSFWSRWLGVYVSPGQTFQDIARQPDFIFPLIASIVSALVFTEVMLGKIGMEQIIRNSIAQSGRTITAEQVQQAVQAGATIGIVISHVMALVGSPIYLAIVAALALLIINAIYGGAVNFKTAFSVACYTNLVNVLAVLMALPMIWFGAPERFNPNNPMPTNVGFFLSPLETSKGVMAIAGSIDLFSFWFIALLGIGYSAATGGKVKPLSIAGFYFGIWLVLVLGKVGLALIMS
jgi:hypothetical protein